MEIALVTMTERVPCIVCKQTNTNKHQNRIDDVPDDVDECSEKNRK